MIFSITHSSPENPFATRLDVIMLGDIREGAKAISRAFPGETIIVIALARVRLTVRNEQVIMDNSDLNYFYDLSDRSEKGRSHMEHHWTNLIGSTSADEEQYR